MAYFVYRYFFILIKYDGSVSLIIQFRGKSHEEVRQYVLATKGVDIGTGMNWSKTTMWILVGLMLVVGGIGVWK